VLDWPLAWVMALVATADFAKTIFIFQRYYSRKWMNVFTGRKESV